MKLLFLSALVAAAYGLESYCKDASGSGLEPEWTKETGFGWYCRCAASPGHSDLEAACKTYTTRSGCYAAAVDGVAESCTWLDTMVNDGELPDDAPMKNPTGGFYNADGTLTDCDGKVFTAEDCAYRNKRNCDDYLGDGICDFGQRFTKAGVRTGPNLACEKFLNDKGDCDCPDTMTCDGYCLDDFACAKEAYGFTTCANWYSDLVCDYGQRTSDFGVSINFDCKIPWIPALADMNHDQGACEPWDWSKRYTTEEYLENFRAECPTAAPSQQPTKNPTNPPSEPPTVDEETIKIDNCNLWKALSGNWDECCTTYPGYEDPVFGKVCVAAPKPTEKPVAEPTVGGCDGSFNKADCMAVKPYRKCMYNAKAKKGERCFAAPADGCADNRKFNKKTGESAYNKVQCLKNDACGWMASKLGPYCFKAEHECNKYTKKKDCTSTAIKAGAQCYYDKTIKGDLHLRCREHTDFAANDELNRCARFKKKKDCLAWGAHGCQFIKSKKDKPPSMSKDKCIDTNAVAYTDWMAAGGNKKGGSSGSTKPKKCSNLDTEKKCGKESHCVWDGEFGGGCMDAK